MLTILSPAKKLDLCKNFDRNNCSYPEFQKQTSELSNILKTKSKQDLKNLMKISDQIAELNYNRNQDFTHNFNLQNSFPASRVFDGEVYSGLKAKTFTKDELDYAQQHLRILSGLYGILKPLDLIQPYRLEMGTKLSNPKGDNLYKFWQEIVTEYINQELTKHRTPILLNLASNEYAKVVNQKQLNYPLITINFKDNINGKLKTVMVYAKKARGSMANYIIKNKIDNVELLKDCVIDGYSYSSDLSSKDSELTFVRNS